MSSEVRNIMHRVVEGRKIQNGNMTSQAVHDMQSVADIHASR
jgi:hypothetical protein